jgi:hypothetical protein
MKKMEDKHMQLYQELIDEVIAEIHLGLQERDLEAIEELLRFCPTENLIGYLPERLHLNFKPLLNE